MTSLPLDRHPSPWSHATQSVLAGWLACSRCGLTIRNADLLFTADGRQCAACLCRHEADRSLRQQYARCVRTNLSIPLIGVTPTLMMAIACIAPTTTPWSTGAWIAWSVGASVALAGSVYASSRGLRGLLSRRRTFASHRLNPRDRGLLLASDALSFSIGSLNTLLIPLLASIPLWA